ncbi:hypothetical protein FGIG_01337 [Fasciola gigantica]|uniref:Noggin n=1 Tax=Fasciola gigantica TaxID=46835 RepID=A0A504YSV9_FASGI|nr:hypothetical protein FGIG_01337 [Fasciola gigantica]
MIVPKLADSSKHYQKLETNFERMNISRHLWELFQRRNQNSEYSSTVLLYPSSRKTSQPLNLAMQNRRKLSTNQSVGWLNRRLPDPLQLLRTENQPGFPIHMPQFPPEHPFNPQAVLTPSEMFRLLGEQHYVPEFMSYAKPLEAITHPDGRLSPLRYSPRYSGPRTRRPGATQSSQVWHNTNLRLESALTLDLSTRLNTIGYDRLHSQQAGAVHQFSRHARGTRRDPQRLRKDRRQVRIKRRVRKALRRLLTDYTSCPVLYRWRDWGSRFWPRWIKEGRCVNLGETSCSIPPGMYCVEAEHRTIVVLRFLCFTSWPRSSCSWYRLNMPVLSRCQCGCSAKSNRVTEIKVK